VQREALQPREAATVARHDGRHERVRGQLGAVREEEGLQAAGEGGLRVEGRERRERSAAEVEEGGLRAALGEHTKARVVHLERAWTRNEREGGSAA
jgi:hypothetical protein